MQEATIVSQLDNSKGTLEHLFKDYIDGTFQAELIHLGEPVGDEKW